VALAIVVWFIAGMSLLVAGIVAQARVDTRLAQVHADRARLVAAGDGAIRLFIAELAAQAKQGARGQGFVAPTFLVGDQSVAIEVVPVAGLVDLNSAQLPLLRELLVIAGSLPPAQANEIAQAIVQWRGSKQRRGRSNRFDSVEDIMRVPGMRRQVYDDIRDYVAAGAGASGSITYALAPSVVKQALRRAGITPPQGEALADPRRIIASGSALRVDAIITSGGRRWTRRQWLDSGGSESSSLPWSAVKVEPPRVLKPLKQAG
jgi:DNA uptake protein ComE-like DNA-binding protein